MGKPNKRHHELCLKYKQEGRRDRNKKLTAERTEHRLEKIKARSAKKDKKVWDGVPKNPETRGSNRQAPLGDFAYRPKMDKMVPFQRERSFMQRVQNQLDAEIMEQKRLEQKKNSKNKEGKNS